MIFLKIDFISRIRSCLGVKMGHTYGKTGYVSLGFVRAFILGLSIKNKSHFSPEIQSAGRSETSPLTQILLKHFL